MHLEKTRILVLRNKLEFCIVSGHFPSSNWPRRMVRGQSGRIHRVYYWHVPCKNRSFVWFAERPLLTTGQCCYFAPNSISRLTSAASPLWGAFLHVDIALQITYFIVNCVTSCHSSCHLNVLALVNSGVLLRLQRPTWRVLAVRDWELVR